MIGLRLSPRLEIGHKIELKLIQRYEMVPQTTCPFCGRVVKPAKENWVSSSTDCRMICSSCGKMFQGLLQIFDQEGIDVGTYHFLCPDQTLYEMKRILSRTKRKYLGEKFLHDKYPEVYFSLLKNFRAYRKARKMV